VITPARSSRWTRSATAGAERLTRRPSSAKETRPSVVSSLMIRRSVSSRRGRSTPLRRESPLFMAMAERNAFDSVCPSQAETGRMLGIAVDIHTTTPRTRALVSSRAVPPHAYFVGSALFHYLGPSFAVLLFARVDVLGVAWLRIASAAVIFAAWRRPWRAFLALDRGGQLLIAALGAVFAVMNACFYISIDRLPLATVAAIEFIGPIALALIGARVGRNFAAVLAAAGGVYLLTHVQLGGEPVGVGFAFTNAALFTAYIVLAHRVARRSISQVPRTRSATRLRSPPGSVSASRPRSSRTCSTSWRWPACRGPRTRCSSRCCRRRRRRSALPFCASSRRSSTSPASV